MHLHVSKEKIVNKGSSLPSGKQSYRPDIDGIRALAVISVILYHFKIPFFDGGFVGVDIFFVISGYLITKGIASSVDKGNFKYSVFYSRRVRRLIPALIAVIVITFIGSAALLSPNDMRDFSGSTIFALLGISNIFFWMQSGYFDSFASLKPLLHTWSLSVELQFYLIWPAIVIFICKNSRENSTRAMCIALFISLAGAISAYYTYINSVSAFFLTPFRMHEFAIGGLVSFFALPLNKFIGRITYTVGLFFVLLSIFSFNVNELVFPGYAAFLPCAGTAMLIASGNKTNVSKLLGNKVISHIGEVSYSLYLVHWPVFVLTSYALVFEPDFTQTVCMLVGTILLSYIMYYMVEKKFRLPKNAKLSGGMFSANCAFLTLIICVISISSWKGNGWEWRVPVEVRNINKIDKSLTTEYTWSLQKKFAARNNFDNSEKTKMLVIGDSQSADFINALSESGDLGRYDVVARTVILDCGAPYIGEAYSDIFFNSINKKTASKPNIISECKAQISQAMDPALLKAADKIILAMYYQPDLLRFVDSALIKLKDSSKAGIYVVGRKNLVKSSIEIVNSFQRLTGVEKYASKMRDGAAGYVNDNLSSVKGVKFIDMLKLTCPTHDSCMVVDKSGHPLFFDKAHFTKFGAVYFSKDIAKQIE